MTFIKYLPMSKSISSDTYPLAVVTLAQVYIPTSIILKNPSSSSLTLILPA